MNGGKGGFKKIKIIIKSSFNPPTHPILFGNRDENLNINIMWPEKRFCLQLYTEKKKHLRKMYDQNS